ncbi:TPA: hypothetical protein N0F65_000450, partial [Lagenidium giganteum]
IAALPKIPSPRTGLDFRPISLLNTDYKVFTLILAMRLRPLLPAIISPTQTGFVPGRSIHDAVDLMDEALNQLPETNHVEAIALLIDFVKAYDTLDRRFLFRTLEWLHCPRKFVRMIEALHQGTTARFQLNGQQAPRFVVTQGIRQGCPIALLPWKYYTDIFCVAIQIVALKSG